MTDWWKNLSVYLLIGILNADPIQIYYMNEICGSVQREITSALLETSKSLTYPNDMDCTVTFVAPEGKRFYLQIQRFITELSADVCYDKLSIFNGEGSGSPSLASELCGELFGELEYNTTGASITFTFTSDDSAKERGFAIFLIAFSASLPCSEDEILCVEKRFCIDRQNAYCDNYNHCGDNSDEQQCIDENASGSNVLAGFVGLLAGMIVLSVVILVIVIIVVYKLYKKYKWNKFLKDIYNEKANKKIIDQKQKAAYPVTHNYQTDEYINKERMMREAAMMTADDLVYSGNPQDSQNSVKSTESFNKHTPNTINVSSNATQLQEEYKAHCSTSTVHANKDIQPAYEENALQQEKPANNERDVIEPVRNVQVTEL